MRYWIVGNMSFALLEQRTGTVEQVVGNTFAVDIVVLQGQLNRTAAHCTVGEVVDVS